ncbi:MAG: NUDIX hydrolase [Coriobacteriia bacterium]
MRKRPGGTLRRPSLLSGLPTDRVVWVERSGMTRRRNGNKEVSVSDRREPLLAKTMHNRILSDSPSVPDANDARRHMRPYKYGRRLRRTATSTSIDTMQHSADHMHDPSIYRVSVRLVLIREDRQSAILVQEAYRRGWGLVGGGILPGETPELAIQRELAEELGYAPRLAFIHLGYDYHFEPKRQLYSFFVVLAAEYDGSLLERLSPTGEVCALGELPIRDLGAHPVHQGIALKWIQRAVELFGASPTSAATRALAGESELVWNDPNWVIPEVCERNSVAS